MGISGSSTPHFIDKHRSLRPPPWPRNRKQPLIPAVTTTVTTASCSGRGKVHAAMVDCLTYLHAACMYVCVHACLLRCVKSTHLKNRAFPYQPLCPQSENQRYYILVSGSMMCDSTARLGVAGTNPGAALLLLLVACCGRQLAKMHVVCMYIHDGIIDYCFVCAYHTLAKYARYRCSYDH